MELPVAKTSAPSGTLKYLCVTSTKEIEARLPFRNYVLKSASLADSYSRWYSTISFKVCNGAKRIWIASILIKYKQTFLFTQ
jgi:hypothetical protein